MTQFTIKTSTGFNTNNDFALANPKTSLATKKPTDSKLGQSSWAAF